MRLFSLLVYLFLFSSSFAQTIPLDQAIWSRIQQLKGEIAPTDSAKKVFKILPVGLTTKFNSHSPYGWNDGGMIMAKALQTIVSAGVYAKWGPLSIQLQPELYYAANPVSYTHLDVYKRQL